MIRLRWKADPELFARIIVAGILVGVSLLLGLA